MGDPVEKIVAEALDQAGINYERDKEVMPGSDWSHSIDFYLTDMLLWIEVCQFHTPRKIEQLRSLPNVILIQGIGAALSFASFINQSPK